MNKIKILAVDDDIIFLETLKKVLTGNEYYVDTISVPNDVMNELINQNYDVILLDVNMPGLSGIELLQQIVQFNYHLPVIIISGQSTIKIAVDAMKIGAYDFIEKPIDSARLNSIIKNAIANKELRDIKDRLLDEIVSNYKMIGDSDKHKKVCHEIKQFANTNSKVLITGETGTGKELVASALHYNSDRKEKPFIKINCAAIPSELLESELFGHIKGSFTGATSTKIGKFDAAEGGTIFLDEIGEMDLKLQAKILRVLEENEIEIIGDPYPHKVDIRIISATNQNLFDKVNEGKFRRDLFHRLNTFRINIPPLRERTDDIIPISHYFIEKYNNEYNKKIKSISPQAISILKNHKWEGNVRELRNVIENTVLFSKDEKIEIEDIAGTFNRFGFYHESFSNEIKSLNDAKEEFEKEYLQMVLLKKGGKMNETADALKIDRSNLFKKLQKYGIK